MHSLSGFEANQIPAAMTGMELRKIMKFRIAVMLLLTAMAERFLQREERDGFLYGNG